MFESQFPKIIGILNITPDSFSDGGYYFDKQNAVNHALELIDNGADIIDIGGESSRPGARQVSKDDEYNRVIPVIKEIKKQKPNITISIDTTKYKVAKAALDNGAEIINDISGLDFDENLAKLSNEYNATLILMHMKGTPGTMQKNPVYQDVIKDVFQELKLKIEKAKSFGVENIIADVGIGFGKTVEHNLKLLKYHQKFKDLKVPLLIGLSRKSFLGKILEIDNPMDRDLPTVIIHSLLIPNGADFIRVHNVKLIKMLKIIYDNLKLV